MVPRISDTPEDDKVDGVVLLDNDDDELDLKFDLDSKDFQDSLREEYKEDPLTFIRLARESPDLTAWITKTFGEEVLADMDNVEIEDNDSDESDDEGIVDDTGDETGPKEEEAPEVPPTAQLRRAKTGFFGRLKKTLASAAAAATASAAANAGKEPQKVRSKSGDKVAVATIEDIGIMNRPPPRCAHKIKVGRPDTTRLQKTTMATDDGRIDMLVAVTQGLLNSRLKYLWALEEEMRSIHVTLDSGEEIKTHLLPPKIHLEIETNEPGSAVYWMMFDYGGHIKIADDDDESGYRILATDGWKFAFNVNIALEGVEPDSEEYDEVKNKLGNEGDFRISRLLADFHTADIMNPRLEFCSFGESDLNDSALSALEILLDRWRDHAIESGLGIMGWSATSNNPSSVASLPATFTPTDQQLQTYPYMAPGQKEPIIGLDDPRANYNMLLYLNMTSSKAFPKDRFLDYEGNWCTPLAPVSAPRVPEIHSTLCISKDVFFKNFILPNLTLLNRASWIEASKPDVVYKGGGIVINWKRKFSPRGTGRDWNFYNSWKPVTGTHAGNSYTGWEWKKSSRGYNSRRKRPLGRGTGEMKTSVMNRVAVFPETNQVKVFHNTKVYMRTEHRRIKSRKGISEIERKGTLTISVASVSSSSSNTQLNITPAPDPAQAFSTSITRFENNFIGKKGTITRERDAYQNALQNHKDFKDGVAKIKNALQKVGAFVIPTGGTFFLRDGTFNKEGDLLFRGSYNGVD